MKIDQSLGQICRNEFPILADRSLIYLDSAASAQKPRQVIDTISEFYQTSYANVHRGVYRLSEEATARFEGTREKVKTFINASSTEEIIFTSGTTASINLVAYAWGRAFLKPGDEILTTIFEHHSNFVPWQLLAEEKGLTIRYVPLNANGGFSKADFLAALSPRTKLASFTYVANGLGIMLPVKELTEEAHRVGAVVHLDAAQAIAHFSIDVQNLAVDFLSFSGHKMYGPSGIGVLFGKRALLSKMPPFLSGGDMIRSVSIKGSTFNDLPYKFEAGTPNIADVIGLGAAVDYLTAVGFPAIIKHEAGLIQLLEDELAKIPGVTILGPVGAHHALVCFTTKDLHPHDLAQFLDREGISVRAGHHCAQPILAHFGIPASTRASVGVYNTEEDIHALCAAVRKALQYFSK